jgi:hypothetical protein
MAELVQEGQASQSIKYQWLMQFLLKSMNAIVNFIDIATTIERE